MSPSDYWQWLFDLTSKSPNSLWSDLLSPRRQALLGQPLTPCLLLQNSITFYQFVPIFFCQNSLVFWRRRKQNWVIRWSSWFFLLLCFLKGSSLSFSWWLQIIFKLWLVQILTLYFICLFQYLTSPNIHFEDSTKEQLNSPWNQTLNLV